MHNQPPRIEEPISPEAMGTTTVDVDSVPGALPEQADGRLGVDLEPHPPEVGTLTADEIRYSDRAAYEAVAAIKDPTKLSASEIQGIFGVTYKEALDMKADGSVAGHKVESMAKLQAMDREDSIAAAKAERAAEVRQTTKAAEAWAAERDNYRDQRNAAAAELATNNEAARTRIDQAYEGLVMRNGGRMTVDKDPALAARLREQAVERASAEGLVVVEPAPASRTYEIVEPSASAQAQTSATVAALRAHNQAMIVPQPVAVAGIPAGTRADKDPSEVLSDLEQKIAEQGAIDKANREAAEAEEQAALEAAERATFERWLADRGRQSSDTQVPPVAPVANGETHGTEANGTNQGPPVGQSPTGSAPNGASSRGSLPPEFPAVIDPGSQEPTDDNNPAPSAEVPLPYTNLSNVHWGRERGVWALDRRTVETKTLAQLKAEFPDGGAWNTPTASNTSEATPAREETPATSRTRRILGQLAGRVPVSAVPAFGRNGILSLSPPVPENATPPAAGEREGRASQFRILGESAVQRFVNYVSNDQHGSRATEDLSERPRVDDPRVHREILDASDSELVQS